MRLTKKIREEILDSVISKIITPKVDKIKKELAIIAQYTSDNRYPKKIRDWIFKAPAGALTTMGAIRLDLKGISIKHRLLSETTYKNRTYVSEYSISLVKSMKILDCDKYTHSVEVNSKYRAKLQKVLENLNSLGEEDKNLRSTISSALQACSNSNQLKTNYPDLVKYLPDDTLVGKVMTISNEDVVKALGV